MRALIGMENTLAAASMVRALAESGHQARVCSIAPPELRVELLSDWDALILDCAGDPRHAFALCGELRQSGEDRGVILLGNWAAPHSLVAALKQGADDAMARPIDLAELVARVEAVTWRWVRMSRRLLVGEIEIRERDRTALVGGVPLDLTVREWTLLHFLATRTGQTVTRAEIFAGVWSLSSDPGTNIIDVHVAHLRRKLGRHGATIRCVRGVGFCLDESRPFAERPCGDSATEPRRAQG